MVLKGAAEPDTITLLGVRLLVLNNFYAALLRVVSDTPEGGKPEQDAVFRRALALGSKGFILETYARFRQVFNARKRPAEPFVTDIGGTDDAICASHRPRKMVVG